MRRNARTRPAAHALLLGALFAAAAFFFAPPAAAGTRPAPARQSDEKLGKRAALYQKFLDNFRRGPAEQKVAYEVARKYLKKFGKEKDPDNVPVVDYLRRWTAKYEEAAAAFERDKKARMGLGPGLPPEDRGTGSGEPPPDAGAGDGARPADTPPADRPAADKPKPRR